MNVGIMTVGILIVTPKFIQHFKDFERKQNKLFGSAEEENTK